MDDDGSTSTDLQTGSNKRQDTSASPPTKSKLKKQATKTKISIGQPMVPDRPSPTRNDPHGSTTRQDMFTLINKRKERNDRRVARHNNSGSGNTDRGRGRGRGRGSQPFRRGTINQHDDTSSSDEEPDDLQRIVVDRRQNHNSSDSDADSDSDATTQSSRRGSKAIK